MFNILSLALATVLGGGVLDEIPTIPRLKRVTPAVREKAATLAPTAGVVPAAARPDAAMRALREAQETIENRTHPQDEEARKIEDNLSRELEEALPKPKREPMIELPLPPRPVPPSAMPHAAPQDNQADPIAAERRRLQEQRAKLAPEARRLIKQARVRRAAQLSSLYADAARPLTLPIDVSAVGRRFTFKTYPLYLPRQPHPPIVRASGTRTDALDHVYMLRRAAVTHTRMHMDGWTAARRAKTPDQSYEERYADRILYVKGALSRTR